MRVFSPIYFFLLFITTVFSQELPPISIYTAKDYNAENQNWSFAQGKNKHVYVANNKGLLEFDGAAWRLYPTPNETILRSVNVIGDKIYGGFYNGFGYWERDLKGRLIYTSLSDEIELLEDEQFWKIEEVEGWVLFQSLQRIYLYNLQTGTYKLIESATEILHMYLVDGVLYYQELNKGVFKLEKGKPVLVSNDKIILKNIIVGLHKVENNLVCITDHNGIYILKNKQLKQWGGNVNKQIKPYTIYSSYKLRNGNLVLGTISNGVIVVNQKEGITFSMNQKKGLGNNTVLSLFEDSENNIWLGLDDGINVIDINTPFKVYKDLNGIIGTVYTSVVYKDRIYLGTNQGLFSKPYNSNDDFKMLANTGGQVWELKIIGNELFCGHNSGTYVVEGTKANLISDINGTWKIESLSANTFIQGNYSGLYVFHKINNQWILKNKIKGFNISSRSFEFLNDHTIFVNHEYKGVYKLTVDKALTQVSNISIISHISKGLHSDLLKYKNHILYSYKKGVYKYNTNKDVFVKDSVLSSLWSNRSYISGVLVNTIPNDKLWGFSKKEIICIEQGGLSTKPIITRISIPLKLRKGATGFENISFLSDNTYLLGNSNGYIILNTNKLDKKKQYRVQINQIKNSSFNHQSVNVNLNEELKFENKDNNFEFACSVPVFNNYTQVKYQYKLEGLSNFWSPWSDDSNILLKNIPFGNYKLSIRARVDGVLTSNVETYRFKIKQPWYIATPMLFLYVVIIVLFSAFMHIMYKRSYNKQKKRLLARKQREIELHKLENEKRLTLLENQKLEEDVDLKSKELASSTMNIIKKNELLNTIKDELLKGEQKNINNVVNIIDKSLNNVDDWKLFEEAFNNADKDFIKKTKTMHPALTSNDLRLCAYLRLNLSSKEIAPLLNISPKSIEVKRYRLRKKMNLSNEQNLTDYILNI
ncbi:helix-turn-helix and ligand-binding sensor domain-containing protein [Wenyingzhuangia aestuarii]|uniref:helix-turn-helix and ligand-binding sensor domain-containing protein n=1 Tax=Wenyingzhuangia aestuarii TaxID=1647582 RepID=UPI00143A1A38|nr:LuxR C-terminal-related transcriptional regulator [Wenyingzhuangia aestuarii]NJB82552.1 DNA-binding CsgD family transcriptional regulator [Wenyingzhuangia aestuarii]